MARTFVIGVGMTKFEKPGTEGVGLPRHGARGRHARRSPTPASPTTQVEQALVGYVLRRLDRGQRAVYELGLTGIPVFNVNNNCSTGSTRAVPRARRPSRAASPTARSRSASRRWRRARSASKFTDRTNPMDRHVGALIELRGCEHAPPAPQMFGDAGREHMERYGTTPEHFAWIGWKNHRHSVNNPYAQFQDEYSLERHPRRAKVIYEPLTKLQCSPDLRRRRRRGRGSASASSTSTGSGTRRSRSSARRWPPTPPSTFEAEAAIDVVGADMSRDAPPSRSTRRRGLGADDVDVIELHDCFSANELITYEALGLCGEGEGGKLVDDGRHDLRRRVGRRTRRAA